MGKKENQKNSAPTVEVASGPTPTPAAAPPVDVELDDKKDDLKQGQKSQAGEQPADTGKPLQLTSTWQEFMAELFKSLQGKTAQKKQQAGQDGECQAWL